MGIYNILHDFLPPFLASTQHDDCELSRGCVDGVHHNVFLTNPISMERPVERSI